jgi:hypothetical protein
MGSPAASTLLGLAANDAGVIHDGAVSNMVNSVRPNKGAQASASFLDMIFSPLGRDWEIPGLVKNERHPL